MELQVGLQLEMQAVLQVKLQVKVPLEVQEHLQEGEEEEVGEGEGVELPWEACNIDWFWLRCYSLVCNNCYGVEHVDALVLLLDL